MLICKCGAAGDVLRTTPLLERLKHAEVDWVVNPAHAPLLRGSTVRIVTNLEELDSDRRYDLVLSLEEDPEIVRSLLHHVRFEELIGTYISSSGHLVYTDSSRPWFDMSLIGNRGFEVANRLKLENRKSYQELLFSMAGFQFSGERYLALQSGPASGTRDVLLAPGSGSRWPSKRWAHYEELADALQPTYSVEWLEDEPTYERLAARVAQSSVVVANDSLPMHVGLSLSIPVCGLFTVTSPWEIHDYGLLTKLVSSRLHDFYYSTEWHADAVRGIPVEDVLEAVSRVVCRRPV